MSKTICIYHANCFDGMAAAWVVSQAYPNAEFIPGQYGDKKLELSLEQDCYENANINDHYVIVDFSLPRQLMELMASKAKNMIVLDHHKTSMANCEGLNFCKFDMNQSGAGLAWRHFFPDKSVPNLIKYVEDRDLWRFSLPYSKEINAYIQSYPIKLEMYDYLATELDDTYGLESARNAGAAVERYKDTMVAAICKHARLKLIGNYFVPLVQSGILMSEVGHYMCQQEYEYIDHRDNTTYMNKPPFAASYFIRDDGYIVYSLRSIGDFDVSEVAKKFGGGGHRNAAGFQLKAEEAI